MRKVTLLGAVASLIAVATPVAPSHAAAGPVTMYFHSDTPVANADHQAAGFVGTPGTYMDATPPSKEEPSIAAVVATGTYPNASIYGPAWRTATAGRLTGDVTVTFWAAGTATAYNVSLFVDETTADTYAPFAAVKVPAGDTPAPAKFTHTFTGLDQQIQRELIVQITADTVVATVEDIPVIEHAGPMGVLYDSTEYPSSLTATIEPPAAPEPQPLGAFSLYSAPEAFIDAHGPNETSIGVNPETNAVMFQMSRDTAQVKFDDSTSPATATWSNVSYVATEQQTLDPYLFTDRATGRTFVSQLLGMASVTAFTDDDGATWTPTQLQSTAPSFDHESLVFGPYPAGMEIPTNLYGRVGYYCSQGLVIGQCQRSDDGGITWGAPLPFTWLEQCAPSHGRITVGPDGALYVPVRDCGTAGQGIFISRDGGVIWEQKFIPGTQAGNSDPVLAIDAAGTVYFTASSNGTIKVSKSTDSGKTWSNPVDVGTAVGMKQTEFAMSVAGDAGRLAVAWYGSKTPGDDQDVDYTGEWALYTATSINGGATWTVQNVTGDDPVQRGLICMGGIGCGPGRNLLDFQGMTMDRDGRIIIGYADGCTSQACIAADGKAAVDADSGDSLGMLARQNTGPLLKATAAP